VLSVIADADFSSESLLKEIPSAVQLMAEYLEKLCIENDHLEDDIVEANDLPHMYTPGWENVVDR